MLEENAISYENNNGLVKKYFGTEIHRGKEENKNGIVVIPPKFGMSPSQIDDETTPVLVSSSSTYAWQITHTTQNP